MKRFLLSTSILFMSSMTSGASDVRVINSVNDPVNVTGSLSIAPSPNAAPVTSTWTVVSTTYPIAVSATFVPPALTTVTFNGVGQPVTSTSDYVVNLVTATFNGVGQPVTSTSTVVVQSTVGVISASPLTVTGSTVGVVTTSLGLNVVSTNTQVLASTVGVVNGGAVFVIGQSTIGVVSGGVPMVVTGSTVGVISATPLVVTGSTVGVISASPLRVTGSTVGVVGTSALGAAPAGNPMYPGLTVSSTSFPTGQANNTMVGQVGNTWGGTITTALPYHLTSSTFSVNMATQSSTEFIIVSSATTSRFNYLCGCTFANSAASAITAQIFQSSSTVAGVDSIAMVIPSSSTVNVGYGCMDPFFRSQFNGQITLRASAAVTSVLMRCLYYIAP